MKQFNKFIVAILLSTLVMTACTPVTPSPTPQTPDTVEPKDITGSVSREETISAPEDQIKAVAQGNNTFAFNLYRQLAAKDGNLVLSPYSISQALAMTYAGAAGTTAEELARVMQFNLAQDKFHPAFNSLDLTLRQQSLQDGKPLFEFNVANALWGQKGYTFLEPFLNTVSKNYGGGLKELDFARSEEARSAINRWVEAQTNNKIKDLIPPDALDELTRLVLTNAVYFKAPWAVQFQPESTQPGDFYLLNGTKTQVPFMHMQEGFYSSVTEDYQIVELPYKGYDFSMVILMPKDGTFTEFEKSLSAEKYQDLLTKLQVNQVVLAMPKFKIESTLGLKDSLQQLGMSEAFSSNADFSGMTGSKELAISDVIQKAFIDVNEEGTEAAAATAVIIGKTSMDPSEPLKITLDHPFIYLIKDRQTNSVLFMGRVVQP
ncbi:MAG TPA: serpin family protein [Bellilinea sp.]|nr:serpin family protein [Bellilinea sp.]